MMTDEEVAETNPLPLNVSPPQPNGGKVRGHKTALATSVDQNKRHTVRSANPEGHLRMVRFSHPTDWVG